MIPHGNQRYYARIPTVRILRIEETQATDGDIVRAGQGSLLLAPSSQPQLAQPYSSGRKVGTSYQLTRRRPAIEGLISTSTSIVLALRWALRQGTTYSVIRL